MKKLLRAGLLAASLLLAAPVTYAQVSVGINISANIAPPAIPEYDQPLCPTDGYLWQPGYWAYDPGSAGYYWVPGVWVAPPTIGYLWTPCYWGYDGGVYVFHQGYWGSHIGFYGGINYGYGYFGVGFAGGSWQGNHFRYNTAVVHVNTRVIHNTYVDRTVIVNRSNSRVSYNGGRGGVTARPRPQEEQAMRERHIQPTSAQQSHQQAASKDRSHFASVNHGRPAAATNRAGSNHAAPKTNGRTNAASTSNPRPAARQPGNAAHNRAPANNPAVQRAQRPQAQQRTQQPRQQQQPRAQQPQRQQQPRAQQPQRQQQPRMQQPQRAAQPHANPGRGGGGEPHEKHR